MRKKSGWITRSDSTEASDGNEGSLEAGGSLPDQGRIRETEPPRSLMSFFDPFLPKKVTSLCENTNAPTSDANQRKGKAFDKIPDEVAKIETIARIDFDRPKPSQVLANWSACNYEITSRKINFRCL